MKFDEYRAHDATGLAALLRSGEVSAGELLQIALDRSAAVNPALKAIVVDLQAQAREQLAGPLAGPFAGVPFLLKDLMQDYAGATTTMGTRATRDRLARVHAEFTRRCLDAGLIVFGKTSTPELALKGVTESQRHGPCRNPWNPQRTPGGSSGGAAAAVAAGIVPMAGANDGGGSIRIPAACCGLFGLRPSRGRVSPGPSLGEAWEGASSDHVITRSVRDSAAMLDVLQGADTGAPFIIAPPAEAYVRSIERDPPRLRIGYCTRSPLGTPVDPVIVAALQDAARLLESLGHQVEEAEPAIDGSALASSYLHLYFGQVAASVEEIIRSSGASRREFELETRALDLLGRSLSAGEYVAQRRRWNEYARALGQYFQNYDLYLTPTLASPPIAIGATDLPAWQRTMLPALLALAPLGIGRLLLSSGIVEQMAGESLRHVPFTQLSNLTGTPSMSVPLHWTDDGLPLGTHFIAPFGREDRLLQLAAELERARPWFARCAPI